MLQIAYLTETVAERANTNHVVLLHDVGNLLTNPAMVIIFVCFFVISYQARQPSKTQRTIQNAVNRHVIIQTEIQCAQLNHLRHISCATNGALRVDISLILTAAGFFHQFHKTINIGTPDCAISTNRKFNRTRFCCAFLLRFVCLASATACKNAKHHCSKQNVTSELLHFLPLLKVFQNGNMS